mgnify:CR=1 FL=1
MTFDLFFEFSYKINYEFVFAKEKKKREKRKKKKEKKNTFNIKGGPQIKILISLLGGGKNEEIFSESI